MSEQISPWLLWGISQNLNLASNFDPAVNATVGQQLVRVNARFPTTWSFFFWVKLLNFAGAAGTTVNVAFDLQMGIGRSLAIIPSFATINLAFPANPTTPGILPGAIAFTSSTHSWGQIDPTSPSAGNATLIPIDRIVGQDIQVSCRALYVAGAGATAQVEVGAQLAPLVHVRPDWFVEQFAAGEVGGH